jgi:hypothetical protein
MACGKASPKLFAPNYPTFCFHFVSSPKWPKWLEMYPKKFMVTKIWTYILEMRALCSHAVFGEFFSN